MRAKLAGLEKVAWGRTHPNNASGVEIPQLLRERAHGVDPTYRLADALLHQDTRFGGAAEAVPFLIELASANETPDRAFLLRLAAGIGAPVEPHLSGIPFDRARIEAVSDDELWSEDSELLDGFAAMSAQDGRAAWLAALPSVSMLVDDEAGDVRIAAMCVLAVESGLPPEHEVRLRHAMGAADPVCWHAALALGHLAERVRLAPESIHELNGLLAHQAPIRRATAAFALAFVPERDERALEALAQTRHEFEVLSKEPCQFEQALMGMFSRALQRVTE